MRRYNAGIEGAALAGIAEQPMRRKLISPVVTICGMALLAVPAVWAAAGNASEWVEGHSFARAHHRRRRRRRGRRAAVARGLEDLLAIAGRCRRRAAIVRLVEVDQPGGRARCSIRRRSGSPTRPAIPSATRATWCSRSPQAERRQSADRPASRAQLRRVQGHLHSRRSRARAVGSAVDGRADGRGTHRRHVACAGAGGSPARIGSRAEARRRRAFGRQTAPVAGDGVPRWGRARRCVRRGAGRSLRAVAEEDRRRRQGRLTFEVDLSKDADIAALKGKQLTATMVSDKGQSEATFPLQ